MRTKIDGKYSIDPVSGCWLWNRTTSKGYGKAWINGKYVRAHRLSYELHVGPIPSDLEIDHLCRNKRCINPDHLEPVTHQVNISRGEGGKMIGARQRARTHCKKGHPYDEENTYVNAKGHRTCRACRRISYRIWWHKWRNKTMTAATKRKARKSKKAPKPARIQKAPWGRPRLYSNNSRPVPILVRIPPYLLQQVDRYLSVMEIDSRPAAIRRMIEIALGYQQTWRRPAGPP